MTVTVIGAGVIGLTTAVVLAERGYPVRVLTAEPPADTTSAVAGAIWGPYRSGPVESVDRWSATSLSIFTDLARQRRSGVRLLAGREVSKRRVEPPRWHDQLPAWRYCADHDLPAGAVTGWRYCAPTMDMPVYLNYLLSRLAAAKGRVVRRVVVSLDDVGPGLVVNCSGMGARRLAQDTTVLPVRGQHVIVGNPGLAEFFMEDVGASTELVGVYPQGDRVVLGGTAIQGSEDRTVDMATAKEIVARCSRVFPALATAPVLAHKVGIRPARGSVRLERLRLRSGRWCVHNYGHGGAGVTLAWGCAYQAVDLVAEVLGPAPGCDG